MNIAFTILLVYCALLLYLTFKYLSQPLEYTYHDFQGKVSVLIAYRNEATHLPSLIEGLLSQENAPAFEVILINDHSNDGSYALVNALASGSLVSASLPEGLSGKKQALRLGAQLATGEVLLFTDADCHHSPQWIKLMVQQFSKPYVSLVAGPFLYLKYRDALTFFQHIEQVLLWGFSKAMASLGHPVMCNGANLAVRRACYLDLVHDIDQNSPSGDDIFLLQEVKRILGKGAVVFLDRKEAVVSSKPHHDLKAFIHQKVRWASKAGKISDMAMNISGILFLLCHIYFLYLLLQGYPKAFFIKIFFELFFLATIYLHQFGRWQGIIEILKFSLRSVLLLALYPLYALYILVLTKTVGFEWKGRYYK